MSAPSATSRLLFVLLATLVAVGPFAAGARAQQADAPNTQKIVVRSNDELVFVIRGLIRAGEYDAARQVIAAWRPDDATYPFRVRYVEGLIQKEKREYQAAIATFRKILAEQPGFTFVRLDLTQTLFLAKEDDAAKYQAELLIAAGLDEQIGGGLRSIVGEIDDRRPIRFRAFASILPSSNINAGTDQQCVNIPGLGCAIIGTASRRKSGVGLLLGGELLFRQEFTKDWAFIGSLGAIGRFYPSIEREDVSLAGAAGIEKRFARGQVAVSVVAEQDYLDLTEASRGYGMRLEGSRYVGQTGRLYGSLTVTDRDYDVGTDQDGWRVEFSGFYDHVLQPTRFVRVLGGAITERTDSAVFSFDEWSGGLGLHSELPKGFTIYAQALYAERDYHAPFVGFGVRHDQRIEAQAIITKRDWNFRGFAPQLTYAFTDNRSNVPFYDFTSHGVDVRLVKQF